MQSKTRTRLLAPWAAGLTLLLQAGLAGALPLLFVDLDLTSPGIQDTLSVAPGSVFDIGVVIEGLEAGAPLQSFELDLDFDSLLLAVIGVASGGFLVEPTLLIESDILAPDVNYALATLGDSGSYEAGILVRITIEALNPGSARFALNDVVLSAPFGEPIEPGARNGAILNVLAIPEPASGLLLLIALGGLSLARRPRA